MAFVCLPQTSHSKVVNPLNKCDRERAREKENEKMKLVLISLVGVRANKQSFFFLLLLQLFLLYSSLCCSFHNHDVIYGVIWNVLYNSINKLSTRMRESRMLTNRIKGKLVLNSVNIKASHKPEPVKIGSLFLLSLVPHSIRVLFFSFFFSFCCLFVFLFSFRHRHSGLWYAFSSLCLWRFTWARVNLNPEIGSRDK